MCGISGIFHKSAKPVSPEILKKINETIVHRGPDADGFFVKNEIGLGHRRLSIIDLETGAQPMTDASGRYTLVFNGEIYNYLELKKKLVERGAFFKTHSDTEVLLYGLILDGVDFLEKLNGMFAFGFWDDVSKELLCARDRMGKKPFYYWNTGDHFVFGSECKVILAHPRFEKKLSHQALKSFFQYESVPAPLSIFENISKLPAGCYLKVNKESQVQIRPYWDIPLDAPRLDGGGWGHRHIREKLIDLLDKSVERRLMSEVPLGVFLSGGIDSSAVVAMMARHRRGQDIKTFSIGFNEKSFDETTYARQIARQFNTDHHEQILTPDLMLDILPEVTDFLDEPFADYSILPTFLLSKFTRGHVTVALGGDGSDEIFAGYPTFLAGFMAEKFNTLPFFIRDKIDWLFAQMPVSHSDISLDFKIKQFLYGAHFSPVVRNQVWLGAFHQDELDRLVVQKSGRDDPLFLVRDKIRTKWGENFSDRHGDAMLYFYQKFYLEDDILVKTDRASMAHSLEVRAPFLDRELVEYVSRLPFDLKMKGTQSKFILKKSLEGILPNDILYRKKKGFGIPISLWLKNQLKEKMLSTLHPKKIAQEGIFDPAVVSKLVEDHLADKRNNRKQLFTLLMFEWWMEKYL